MDRAPSMTREIEDGLCDYVDRIYDEGEAAAVDLLMSLYSPVEASSGPNPETRGVFKRTPDKAS